MENQGASADNAETDLITDNITTSATLVAETTNSLSDGLNVKDTATHDTAETITAPADAAEDVEITFEDMSDESENQTTSNYATGSVEVTDTLDEILNQNVSVSGSSAEILPQNRITVIFRLLLKIDDKQGRTIRKSRSVFYSKLFY